MRPPGQAALNGLFWPRISPSLHVLFSPFCRPLSHLLRGQRHDDDDSYRWSSEPGGMTSSSQHSPFDVLREHMFTEQLLCAWPVLKPGNPPRKEQIKTPVCEVPRFRK